MTDPLSDRPADAWADRSADAPPDSVAGAAAEALVEALVGFDAASAWHEVAPRILPVLPRRRPLPVDTEVPVAYRWPCGLTSTFGIDLGPAFAYVAAWSAERWGIGAQDLADQALANVRARAGAATQAQVTDDRIGDLPVTAFQSGDGWASALVLAPDLLGSMIGPGPALILVPMRDLVLALPPDTDPAEARRIMDRFEAIVPNALAVPILAFDGGRITVVSEPPGARRGMRPMRH